MSPAQRQTLCLLGAALLTATVDAPRARADGPYEGTFRQGPTRIQVQIESWGDDCSRRPESTTGPGGGTVQVTQDGDDLVFHGQRTTRTNGCWSENGAVRRASSSFQAGTWRTVCRTPEEDSRGEVGTYTLHAASNDRLDFTDVSRYDWQLNTSHCTATITTTQTFTRVGAATAAPTPPAPNPSPEPQTAPTCTPGAAARLAVRPVQLTVAPGERQCFTARVLDAAGCPLRGTTAVTWELRAPAGAAGELHDGCFHAADTGGNGEFTVVATSGSMRDEAHVRVQSADLSDLIARRSESGLFGAPATTPQTASATVHSSSSSRISAVTATQSNVPWVAFGIGSAVVLLLVVVLVVMIVSRRRRALTPSAAVSDDSWSASASANTAAAEPAPTAALVAATAHTAPKPKSTCPVCQREYEGLDFCPRDGTALAAGAQAAAATAQGLICPTCRRGYPADAKYCPHDGEELIPYGMYAARARAAPIAANRTKICPKCGERYALDIGFCGKDGAELVPMN